MTAEEKKVNEVFNLAVYLQFMAAFDPETEFEKIKNIVISTYDFIKTEPPGVINERLPQIESTLSQMVELYTKKYPPKRDIQIIAGEWNELFKRDTDVFSKGISLGWLKDKVDPSFLKLYEDAPYHFRIGLVAHKGFGGVEEEFLLKDAFNILVKAEHYYNLLLRYGSEMKKEESENRSAFTKEIYIQITDLKYEVSSFSRLSIVSFYAFVEALVNSVGYSFNLSHQGTISPENSEILNGQKNGRYLQLRSKLERFQAIIRDDKRAVLVLSDDKQIIDPFKTFFNDYESLRNSSVHYSPRKDSIWLRPDEWINIARDFSKLAMSVGLEFWKACYPMSEGPSYLGKLDYKLHYDKSISRFESLQAIEKSNY